MRKLAVLLLVMMLALGGFTTGYAAEAEVSADSTITLEEARSLAYKNSRNLKQYGISVDKAQYQLYVSEDEEDEIYHDLNSMYTRYESLLNQISEEKDPAKISELQKEISSLEEQMTAQNEKIDSSSDSVDDAEYNYDDSVRAEEDYRKKLGFIVEELYTAILSQEESLLIAEKEFRLKKHLLDIERKRLQVGKSTGLKVSELEADIAGQNNTVVAATNDIKTKKGQLNDLMGREYDDELNLVPFEVPAAVEIPEYPRLLSGAGQSYSPLAQIRRDIRKEEDKLDDEDDYYQKQLLKLDIKEKELQYEEEKARLNEAIVNLMADVQSKQEGYQLAVINLKNAQKSYEWDKKRYEMGLISKTTLLESELNYLNLKSKETSGRYALYLAQLSLELARDGILM